MTFLSVNTAKERASSHELPPRLSDQRYQRNLRRLHKRGHVATSRASSQLRARAPTSLRYPHSGLTLIPRDDAAGYGS